MSGAKHQKGTNKHVSRTRYTTRCQAVGRVCESRAMARQLCTNAQGATCGSVIIRCCRAVRQAVWRSVVRQTVVLKPERSTNQTQRAPLPLLHAIGMGCAVTAKRGRSNAGHRLLLFEGLHVKGTHVGLLSARPTLPNQPVCLQLSAQSSLKNSPSFNLQTSACQLHFCTTCGRRANV